MLYANPWYYQSYDVCSWMISREHAMGFTEATICTPCVLRVLLCKAKVTNRNFCDLISLLQLACSSTFVKKLAFLCCNDSNFYVVIQTILALYIIIVSIYWGQVQSLQQLHLLLLLSSLFPWLHMFSAFVGLLQRKVKHHLHCIQLLYTSWTPWSTARGINMSDLLRISFFIDISYTCKEYFCTSKAVSYLEFW